MNADDARAIATVCASLSALTAATTLVRHRGDRERTPAPVPSAFLSPVEPRRPAWAFDPALIRIMCVVALGAFVSILDMPMVMVAIDALSRHFDSDLATTQWVSTAYLAATAVTLPVAGWLAGRFGSQRVFMATVGLLLIGSALSGAAQSIDALIAGRIVQGLGAGMIMPVGLTILVEAAGQPRVNRVIALFSAVVMSALISGPVLGGVLIDYASWRWIFYINVPLCAILITAAQSFVPNDAPDITRHPDWPGLALLAVGLATFMYGFNGVVSGPALRTWPPMAVGVALLAGATYRTARCAWPFDLRLLGNRAVRAATLTAGTTMLVTVSALFLIPLYYQVVLGHSALEAGLLMIPHGIGVMVAGPVAGRVTELAGARPIVLAGLGMLLIGLLGWVRIGDTTPQWQPAVFQLTMGLGVGTTSTPAASAIVNGVKQPDVGEALFVLNFSRHIASAFGVLLLSVVLSLGLTSQLPHIGGGVVIDHAQQALTASKLAAAFNHAFWVSAGLVVLSVLLALTLPRGRPRMGPTGSRSEAVDERPVYASHIW